MALPKWITPAGNLGIIPEQDYFQYTLDAYDASAGTLVYSRVSGKLPVGIQITSTGVLRGIPVSEQGGDQDVEYTFTIRVKNSTTNGLADRTFTITVTNVEPPVISNPTRNSYLGLFLDGAEYEKQLEAVEQTPGATLTWSLQSGDLPPGLSLTSTGLLSGYFEPIPSQVPGTDADWDQSAWSYIPWDSNLYAVQKRFTFTIEVTDGVNSDLSTYTLDVFPRSGLSADRDDISVDVTLLGTGVPLTVDTGRYHNPIITTQQSDFANVREATFYSFQLEAIDLDGDQISWSVPALTTGSFDEQDSPVYDYVASTLINGRLYSGVFPDLETTTDANANTSSSTLDYTQAYLEPGTVTKIINSSGTWSLGTVTDSVEVLIAGNSIVSANTGFYLTQASSGANATITSSTATTGNITIKGEEYYGNIRVQRPTYQITFSGNILANVGDYITQSYSGANARVTSAVSGTNKANVIYISNYFRNASDAGNTIAIRGLPVSVYPTANVKDIENTTITANVGEYVTQTGSTGNARITGNISDADTIPIQVVSGSFNQLSGNILIGGVDAEVWITRYRVAVEAQGLSANVGDYIYQYSTGANAQVTSNVAYSTVIPVEYQSGTFSTSGNLTLNGANVKLAPTTVNCYTQVTATYSDSNYFDVNSNVATAKPAINASTLTYSNITSILSVSVTEGGLATEGTVGFDSDKFDQGTLTLPPGLTLVEDSGWLYGTLPDLGATSTTYEFEVVASKDYDSTYQDSQLFTLTVLGDLNDRVDWVTASNLGLITTGEVSDLFVYATSTLGKTLVYELTSDSAHRLPQGLQLTSGGLISGRVSFQVFSLDLGTTTMDEGETTFDFTYTFTVTARDVANTISSSRTFTITIRQFDKIPYENLYLKALPNYDQRTSWINLINDTAIFPRDKIYRIEDPWFGLQENIKTLFLAGLSPSALEKYMDAVDTNHFDKRLTFSEIKTARALDTNFNVKYEVVYIEVKDANTNSNGQGPKDTLFLNSVIDNPYYDEDGNSYTTAYPNSFENMSNVVVNSITYQDKGVLPDWMTSRQEDGKQLGFVRAVVLAYTKPGESKVMAYRLRERDFDFNSVDFTVDRYQLDNSLTTNYDLTSNTFAVSRETTFDRYPALTSTLNNATTVDYAVSTRFEDINGKYLQDLKDAGGLDGIKNIKDGDTLIFAQQEYSAPGSTLITYDEGWSNVIVRWDEIAYDFDEGTVSITDDSQWDEAIYVPGYNEYIVETAYADGTAGFPTNPSDGNLAVVSDSVYSYDEDSSLWRYANQRAAVWKVNINNDDIVELTLVRGMDLYDAAFVRNGFTYGGTYIYFDPAVKSEFSVPNYTLVPQQIKTNYTTFDGNGTRFYNNRDSYAVPESGDKYIKFAKTGVFT